MSTSRYSRIEWAALSSFLGIIAGFILYHNIKKERSTERDKEIKGSEKITLANVPRSIATTIIKTNSSSLTSTESGSQDQENIEILVHNISHKDFILFLQFSDVAHQCVARPEFSHYNSVCRSIYDIIKLFPIELINVLYEQVRSRQDIKETEYSKIPIGYDYKQCTTPVQLQTSMLRMRQNHLNDSTLIISDKLVFVRSIYIPLLALLVPKWLASIDRSSTTIPSGTKQCRKILFLVSGEGTRYTSASRKDSGLSRSEFVDNSTEYCGKIMQVFIEQMYPDIEVILVHSRTNVFRYDENIEFVKTDLVPRIEKLRNSLAHKIGAKWRDRFHMSLSLADGASARVSAINASLRYYKPSFMHFWQLKTFYSEGKIYEDDIECHSYEEILTIPAVPPESTDPLVQQTVEMMKQFITDFDSACMLPEDKCDLDVFWLRKTRKPVLAVLLVQTGPQEYKTYRGTNMEVSMPTGSLCAERNVIGSALADNLGLRRQDFRVLAVYSTGPITRRVSRRNTSISVCGECVVSGTGTATAAASPSIKKVIRERKESWTEGELRGGGSKPPSPPSNRQQTPPQSRPEEQQQPSTGRNIYRTVRPSGVASFPPLWPQEASVFSANSTTNGGDSKDVLLSAVRVERARGETKTFIVEESDMNPLKPCGACLEWLKKIGEVNPEFTIVTFTDFNCAGVYQEQIDTFS